MSLVKDLLIFAGGAALGTAVTYFIVNKRCNERVDAELAEMQKYFNVPKKTEETTTENAVNKPEKVVVEATKTDATQITATPEKDGIFSSSMIPSPENRTEYHKVVHHNTEVLDIPRNDYTGEERFVYPNDDEYAASVEDYELNDLEYYTDDGSCRDADGDPYEAMATLGPNWKAYIGRYVTGRCYVLDTVKKQGWEVMIQPGSYADDYISVGRYDPNNPDDYDDIPEG